LERSGTNRRPTERSATLSRSVSGGKSSGLRVIYWDNERSGVIFLVAVFGKTEKSDLTEQEKRVLKAFIKTL